jgi:hypothetical protein
MGHAVPLVIPPLPLPLRVFVASFLFSTRWTEGSSVSTFVFRNVEDKVLKTCNLFRLVWVIEPETTPRIL